RTGRTASQAHTAQAERQRMKMPWRTLSCNEVTYNREGGIVHVVCDQVDGRRLRVRVPDQGKGIPPDKLSRLYTPFDRLGAEETSVEGTGLGLALTRRLVEAMDGTISVQSEVGRGTTFAIELPLAGPLETG